MQSLLFSLNKFDFEMSLFHLHLEKRERERDYLPLRYDCNR